MLEKIPLLVIEDDRLIWELIQIAFEHDAIPLQHVETGAEALAEISRTGPDLILCDIRLPDANGLDLCRFAKQRNPYAQVLMLTSLKEEGDKIVGLEAGADDYITKPFGERELRSRVRAALRRLEALEPLRRQRQSRPETPPLELRIGELRLSAQSRRAWRQDVELELTRKEFDLLWLLAEQPGKVYSRQELIQRLWANKPELSELSINGHVRRLREKVDEPFRALPLVESVRGVGYRLRT